MSECVSGGFTPCRQLRPSSRREHVSASNSHVMEKKLMKVIPHVVPHLNTAYTNFSIKLLYLT